MISDIFWIFIAALATEWALIINTNRPLLQVKSAQKLAIVLAVILLMIAFGVLVWI